MAGQSLDERAFALSCDILRLLVAHGIRPELRESLTQKQRQGTHAFQCAVLARNLARQHVDGWNKDRQYAREQAQSAGGAA